MSKRRPKFSGQRQPQERDAETPKRAAEAADIARLRRLQRDGVVLVGDPAQCEWRLMRLAPGAPPKTIGAALSDADVMRLRSAEWIVEEAPIGRVRRFALSPIGAARLRREAAADAGSEVEAPEQAQHRVYAREDALSPALDGGSPARATPRRVNTAESPLAWLARRRDARGAPFLDAIELEAGERLRADFEAAQLGPRVAQNWDRFLAVVDERRRGAAEPSGGPARDRIADALSALGPDLSDAALRVCCMLEGLETVERAHGWSARSGKVVLRIALRRLVAHYGLDRCGTENGPIRSWRAPSQDDGLLSNQNVS